MRTLARGVLLALGICLLCIVVMGGRYLLFEYRHGDREMAARLVGHLL